MTVYNDSASVAAFSDMSDCDVRAENATTKAISKLVDFGIISGYPDNSFKPNGEVTRAELVAMFTRIFNLYNWDKLILHDNLYANYYMYFWRQEQEVERMVNEERRQEGLRELRLDPNLQALARIKSIDFMVNDYFAHESPIYGRPSDMSKKFRYISTLGENIATTYQTASSAHNTWKNSPGHHENYMNGSYTIMACGMTNGGSVEFFGVYYQN